MYWLRTKYHTWAKKQGIELLREDFSFIERILHKLPEPQHKPIMRLYAEKWHEGMGDTDNVSKKHNAGRFRANSWLLERLE